MTHTSIEPTVTFLRERFTRAPHAVLVLGSGLGGLADEIEDAVHVPFDDIPGFPRRTQALAGHAGQLVAGRMEGVEVVAMQGRFHLYEGWKPSDVALPVRALASLGARSMLLTNAAGGIRPGFVPGDLMLIADHLNLMFQNPLIGEAYPGETRFPDMSDPYDAGFRRAAEEVARELKIPVTQGVYAGLLGPTYETPAEVRMLGRLVLGEVNGEPVVAMQGRVHSYEGYASTQVAFPARVLCALGIRALVVTNAAGGINAQLTPGDLMVITDHINLSGWNALTGANDERLGPRFPDMSHAYSPALRERLLESSRRTGVALRQGVYAMVAGPSYETPAEIRMLRTLGADAVGMSTVPEVVAARHMGVPVAGVSCITNFAAGLGDKPLTHEEVAETAERVKGAFSALLADFLSAVARSSPER